MFTPPYGEATGTFLPAPTTTITPTPTSAPITHDTNHGLSKSATIAISVAVTAVIVILIVAVGYYLWAKRRTPGPQKLKETDSLPLRKYPGLKNLEPQEREVVDGPRVEIWGD